MNPTEYQASVAAKECISCGLPTDGVHVRCDECRAEQRLGQLFRYQSRTTPKNACTLCRQLGHNKRRCPTATGLPLPEVA